ncbi:MAG: Delta-aminolevulinic acid dehydratase [Syntrophorhabdaceae bacterium PtaU1.Bin034]|nr:MAG: Delta-aminolevulinic acid dehydratase [Syntrophorhabdaceae bacterium PtaU1.Bin034]
MGFPEYRPRRLRRNATLRGMVQETELSVQHLIYPLFIKEGLGDEVPIPSMPGISQLPLDKALKEIEAVAGLSIPAILIFGIPEKKDEVGSGAYDENGIVQKAAREIKKRFGSDVLIVADLCFCEYTSHGHCGVIKNGDVDNDETLKLLALAAVSQAEAGADIIAPSDMMDGRVRAVREALDRSDLSHIPIMSYAAKYASALYGPFRDAAESAPQFGDRRSYQMDPPNAREALREMELDVEEGADIIMVKPALFYLDILSQAKQKINRPLAAYSVSGEYAMIKFAADRGYLDYRRTVTESTISIKRAGADIIITYFAKDIARWIKE